MTCAGESVGEACCQGRERQQIGKGRQVCAFQVRHGVMVPRIEYLHPYQPTKGLFEHLLFPRRFHLAFYISSFFLNTCYHA